MSELISNVKVFPLQNPVKGLLANASFTVSEAFVIKCMIRQSEKGLWVAMPSQASKKTDDNGNPVYYDQAFPITKEARAEMNEKVIAAYNEQTGSSSESQPTSKKKGDGVPF